MLIMLIGWAIAGGIFIYRGNRMLEKSLMCSDEAERAALAALAKRNRWAGISIAGTSSVGIVIVLIILAGL